MTSDVRKLSASVQRRLLNQARRSGDDFQVLLISYCYERFLYRLGRSSAHDRFVLKGAMLLRTWSEHPYRSTQDMDFLRNGDGSAEAIRSDIGSVCQLDVDPDGVVFDAAALRIEAIREEDATAGVRAILPASSGKARLNLQIDIGVGDSVWPPPELADYPTLLDFPAPRVLVYPRETVIAEKLAALIVLGDRNSRIKDYFDLHYLAEHFAYDRATLGESVRRTLAKRNVLIPHETPIGLTPLYWSNVSRPPQIRAFARRARLDVGEDPGAMILAMLETFLLPVLDDLRRGGPENGTWPAGGPWR